MGPLLRSCSFEDRIGRLGRHRARSSKTAANVRSETTRRLFISLGSDTGDRRNGIRHGLQDLFQTARA